MNINKDRTAVYTKMCAGLLAMVLEDILYAEDCVGFKLGVAKAGQYRNKRQRQKHMTEDEQAQ